MAGNLENGRGNGRANPTLSGVRSRKGAKLRGNNHLSATISGKANYPNVPRNASVIKGSRARGKTLDTRLDPPLFQP
jgi:hypothetical protein